MLQCLGAVGFPQIPQTSNDTQMSLHKQHKHRKLPFCYRNHIRAASAEVTEKAVNIELTGKPFSHLKLLVFYLLTLRICEVKS